MSEREEQLRAALRELVDARAALDATQFSRVFPTVPKKRPRRGVAEYKAWQWERSRLSHRYQDAWAKARRLLMAMNGIPYLPWVRDEAVVAAEAMGRPWSELMEECKPTIAPGCTFTSAGLFGGSAFPTHFQSCIVVLDDAGVTPEWLAEMKAKGIKVMLPEPPGTFKKNKRGIEYKLVENPPVREFEVWMEGFLDMGMEGHPAKASFEGKVMARNFKQACHILMCRKFLAQAEEHNEPGYDEYAQFDRWDYDPQRLTVWGCRLYDNEADARKAFG